MTLSLLSLKKPRRRSIALRSMASPRAFDTPGTKLGKVRVDVRDVQAEVVVLLNAEAVVERVDSRVGLCCRSRRVSILAVPLLR